MWMKNSKHSDLENQFCLTFFPSANFWNCVKVSCVNNPDLVSYNQAKDMLKAEEQLARDVCRSSTTIICYYTKLQSSLL